MQREFKRHRKPTAISLIEYRKIFLVISNLIDYATNFKFVIDKCSSKSQKKFLQESINIWRADGTVTALSGPASLAVDTNCADYVILSS